MRFIESGSRLAGLRREIMRILIITQYFPPERGAVRRLFEFAKIFRDHGHDVTVLTAMPNYPDGILPDRYRGKFFVREKLDGLNVCRSYVLPAANSKPKRRMIGFITFLLSTLINSFRIKGKFDLVIASSVCAFVPDYGEVLQQIKTILKPGSRCLAWGCRVLGSLLSTLAVLCTQQRCCRVAP